MTERQEIAVPLIVRVARGDRQAFEKLYGDSSPRLYAICLKMLGNVDEAQDVLQDVFVKIWHHADEYHAGRGTPQTWMTSIARYACLDSLRARFRQRGLEQIDEDLVGDAPDPQQAALRIVDRRLLDQCLGELDDRHRASIQMAYFHGFSHHELASRLNAPLGTVKSWVRRGVAVLRRCLER